MSDRTGGDHDRFRRVLPDLAVGILDGRERAAVLDHVHHCAFCSVELEELTALADGLVHLAPEVDPPVGFESRVIEGLELRPVALPRRRRPVIAAAVAAAAVILFGLGWAAHSTTGPSGSHAAAAAAAPQDFQDAALRADGRSLGTVGVYSDGKGWLFMTVDSAGYSGSVVCRVTSRSQVTKVVGTFDVVSGRGSWATPLPAHFGEVEQAELVAPGGRVLATARLT